MRGSHNFVMCSAIFTDAVSNSGFVKNFDAVAARRDCERDCGCLGGAHGERRRAHTATELNVLQAGRLAQP
jgi:hypothetical protein